MPSQAGPAKLLGMVAVEEIKDGDSLRVWLQTGSRRGYLPVGIASRAALRVLPYYWNQCQQPNSEKQDLSLLPIIRACLNALLSFKSASGDSVSISAVEQAAAAAAENVANIHKEAALAGSNDKIAAVEYTAASAFFAEAAGNTSVTRNVVEAVAAAAQVVGGSERSFWKAIQFDCTIFSIGDVSWHELWPGGDNLLSRYWTEIWTRESADKISPHWKFWVRWYDGILTGAEPDWDLLKQVASIEPEVWDAGPGEVAKAIKKIEASASGNNLEYRVGQMNEIAEQLKASEEKAGRLSITREGQENALAKISDESERLAKNWDKLEKDFSTRFQRLQEIYKQNFEAALSAFNEQQAVKAPVELWKAKQEEHDQKSKTAFRWFLCGLAVVSGSASLILFIVFSGADWVAQVLAPIGCDPENKPELCKGFSFRGLLVTGTVLTILTLLLWLTRLRMKEYLSERHLALDARERQAFVQTYLGLVAEGDVSEEAKEQRALVYSALFRPSTDGIVKEDGGLDPSITAAISKLLSK